MPVSLLRIADVTERIGRRKSTVYLNVRRGLMTPPVKLGARISGWPSSEVDELIRAEIAGATPDELRKLVSRLVAERSRVAA